MRCKYERVLSVIHQQLNREPEEDEVFTTLRKADKAEREQLLEKLDRMITQLLNLNENFQMQMKLNEELKRVIAGLQKHVELLRKENAALKEQKKLSDKNRFGSKTRKLSSRP